MIESYAGGSGLALFGGQRRSPGKVTETGLHPSPSLSNPTSQISGGGFASPTARPRGLSPPQPSSSHIGPRFAMARRWRYRRRLSIRSARPVARIPAAMSAMTMDWYVGDEVVYCADIREASQVPEEDRTRLSHGVVLGRG